MKETIAQALFSAGNRSELVLGTFAEIAEAHGGDFMGVRAAIALLQSAKCVELARRTLLAALPPKAVPVGDHWTRARAAIALLHTEDRASALAVLVKVFFEDPGTSGLVLTELQQIQFNEPDVKKAIYDIKAGLKSIRSSTLLMMHAQSLIAADLGSVAAQPLVERFHEEQDPIMRAHLAGVLLRVRGCEDTAIALLQTLHETNSSDEVGQEILRALARRDLGALAAPLVSSMLSKVKEPALRLNIAKYVARSEGDTRNRAVARRILKAAAPQDEDAQQLLQRLSSRRG